MLSQILVPFIAAAGSFVYDSVVVFRETIIINTAPQRYENPNRTLYEPHTKKYEVHIYSRYTTTIQSGSFGPSYFLRHPVVIVVTRLTPNRSLVPGIVFVLL